MKFIAAVIATLFGLGYIPYVAGTVGTVVSLIACLFLPTTSGMFAVWIVIGILISIPIAHAAEQHFDMEDDRRIIIDEVIGYMVAVAYLPKTAIYFLSAFILFRFFDIFKMSLIKKSQELPKGIGVVADDVLAGMATNIILQLMRLLGGIFI